jgi:hypothetical protein
MVGGKSHLASGDGGNPTYKVSCSLCTCKCVEERRKGETHARARLPRLASPGQAWRGEVRRWVQAHDVRVNSPLKSGPKPRRAAAFFCRLFCYESVSNTFDRDRPSRLRDVVTLGRSSL